MLVKKCIFSLCPASGIDVNVYVWMCSLLVCVCRTLYMLMKIFINIFPRIRWIDDDGGGGLIFRFLFIVDIIVFDSWFLMFLSRYSVDYWMSSLARCVADSNKRYFFLIRHLNVTEWGKHNWQTIRRKSHHTMNSIFGLLFPDITDYIHNEKKWVREWEKDCIKTCTQTEPRRNGSRKICDS